MKHRFIIFIIIISFFSACQEDRTLWLNAVETLLSTNPDSALIVISSINPNELKPAKEKARYALLMSAVLDKNYIDVQSDSLISIAVDYYSLRKCDSNRMRSWYYLGIVLKNAGEYIPSMLSFEKAEQDALLLKDFFYLGLICRNKASLYSYTNNNTAAIECQKMAVHYFDQANAVLYKQYSEASLAIDYSNNLEFDRADSLLSDIVIHTTDSFLKMHCDINRASNLIKQDTLFSEAIRLYRSYPETYYDILDYAYLAQAFEMTDQKDLADHWMAEAYARCQNREQAATLDYMASRIKLNRGDFKAAFYLVDHATTVQDSVTRVLLQQSLSAAQRDYYKNESQLREERIQRLRERTGWGLALGVLSLLLTITLALLRARKSDRQLQEQMALLALEERNLERVTSENAHLVGSLFNEKIGRLEQLNDLYFKEEDEKQKDRIFKQIRQTSASMRKDPTLFPSLEKDLDCYCNGIMTKLREQVPSIKGETNLRTIMLFFAGFSYPVVQFILNKVSIESLKTARYRFRKEILSADAADADLFLKMLEVKKQPQADTNESLNC